MLRLQVDSSSVVGVFSLGEHTQRHLLTQGTLTLTHQRLSPITQRQHIRRAQTPTRTRQQARQSIRTVRISQHTQRRHQIHNLRLGKQTAQTHLLHRNTQALAFHTNRVQLTVYTRQHRNLRHLQARTHRTITGTMRRVGALILAHRLRTHRRNTLGNSHSLLAVRVVVRQINAPHHARGSLLKGGRARLPHQGAARAQVRNLSSGNIAVGGTHPLGNLLQLLRHVVRRVQHRNVVTPRDGQEQRPHMLGREMTVEAEHLTVRSATETVNRLLRVTHSHHRMRRNTRRLIGTVNRGEQAHLRVRSVLELVQQNHLEAGTLTLTDRRVSLRNAGGKTHQVTKIQYLHAPLHAGVAHHHARVHSAVPQQTLDLQNVLLSLRLTARLGHRRIRRQLLGAEVNNLLRLHQVLRALVRKLQHLVNHGRRRHRHAVLIEGKLPLPVLHNLRGKLPLLRIAKHLRVLLHAQAQTVLLDEVIRVRVVGEHGRVSDALAQLLIGRGDAAATAQSVQANTHTAAQLGCRLAGEGHAKHLFRAHKTVIDQPNHAVNHGRGLTRTGARNDEGRGGARLNHADLLGGRLLTVGAVEHLGNVEGTAVAGRLQRGVVRGGFSREEHAVGQLPAIVLAPLGGGEHAGARTGVGAGVSSALHISAICARVSHDSSSSWIILMGGSG